MSVYCVRLKGVVKFLEPTPSTCDRPLVNTLLVKVHVEPERWRRGLINSAKSRGTRRQQRSRPENAHNVSDAPIASCLAGLGPSLQCNAM